MTKNWQKLLFPAAVVMLLLTASCSSSRVFNHSYNSVADVAKERFFQNTWTANGTRQASMREKKNTLKISYYEWEFPNIKIYCQVYVEDYGHDKTKVWVYVKDYDSWWYPFNVFSPTLASGVLDAFEKRLKWYKFGWGEMPWDKFNNKTESEEDSNIGVDLK